MNRYFAPSIIAIVFLSQMAYAEQNVQVTWLEDSIAVVTIMCSENTIENYNRWLDTIDSIQSAKGVIIDLRSITGECEGYVINLENFLNESVIFTYPGDPEHPENPVFQEMLGLYRDEYHHYYGPVLVLYCKFEDYVSNAYLEHFGYNREAPTVKKIGNEEYGFVEAKRDLKELIHLSTTQPK